MRVFDKLFGCRHDLDDQCKCKKCGTTAHDPGGGTHWVQEGGYDDGWFYDKTEYFHSCCMRCKKELAKPRPTGRVSRQF
jgi:hypothetical protein